MSDLGEYFKDYRAFKKEEREKRYSYAIDKLGSLGIEYEQFNGGLHLKIPVGGYIVDFWPTTGLWMYKSRKKRGLGPLIKFITKLRQI